MIACLYDCFRFWSDSGSVFIVSDTHFDDKDRQMMGYNFSEQDQMTQLKKYLHKGDTLIHLGDVGNPEYLEELRCYKVLIKGNHDQNHKSIPNNHTWHHYFNEVYNGPLVISPKLILSHEPIDASWALNIHGHDHSGQQDSRHLNLAPPHASIVPFNLGQAIKDGLLSGVTDIHRLTIDYATEHPIHKG